MKHSTEVKIKKYTYCYICHSEETPYYTLDNISPYLPINMHPNDITNTRT